MIKFVTTFIKNAKEMNNGDYALICLIDSLHQMALTATNDIDKVYYNDLAKEVLNNVE